MDKYLGLADLWVVYPHQTPMHSVYPHRHPRRLMSNTEVYTLYPKVGC